MSKTTKKKVIFFGGEFLEIDDQLKDKIQGILDNAIQNAFKVYSVKITKDEVEVEILRSIKDYYETADKYVSLDDTIILSGHLEKAAIKVPIPPHPFADYCQYHFSISDIMESYNELMKKSGYKKLKDLKIDSTDKSVIYHYCFK